MSIERIFAFEKLKVWQDAREWVKTIYQLTQSFPNSEKFGITSQFHRVAISIPTNIAEGSGRQSAKNKAHFSHLAYSSLLESLNLLILAFDQGYLSGVDLARIFHPNSAAACESLMQTALGSGLGLSGMSNTALRRNPRPPCLHHAARRLATNRYEISGLDFQRNRIQLIAVQLNALHVAQKERSKQSLP